MKRHILKICCCLLVLAALCAGREVSAGKYIGAKLKNFKAKTATGDTFDLYKTLETKSGVIIDLWYSECMLCVYPMMRLEMSLPRHPDIAAICLNIKDKPEEIAWYAESRGLTQPLFAKDPGVRGQLGVNVFPRMILVGKGGVILDDDVSEMYIEGAMLYAEGMTDKDYEDLAAARKKYAKYFNKDTYIVSGDDSLLLTPEENYMPILATEMDDSCAPESKLSFTVNGDLRKISVDENYALLKGWKKITQFYILNQEGQSEGDEVELTVDVTLGSGMNAKKAFTRRGFLSGATGGITYFSEAKKNKNTYTFTIPVTDDAYIQYFYPSENHMKDGYAGFAVFRSEEHAAWFFDQLSMEARRNFTWHVEE